MDLPTTYVDRPTFHSGNEPHLSKMKYSNLGSTDLKLSQLGVGGASLGQHYGIVNEKDGISLVRQAVQWGINYIDTSPYYGHTYSETLIGKALADVPRQTYYISTKVGRYGTSWADFFDHSSERIVKEFENSLLRLGLDYVDIVFVHDIEFSSISQILHEALPAVQSLVEKGKARYIGVSAYPVSVLKDVVQQSPVKIDVVLSYARSCLFDDSMKSYAPFFQDKGVGLINASLTGMGLLTNEGPPVWHPADVQLKQICRNASLYCKEKEVELGKLAIYYGMKEPYYSSHLVGMRTLKEVQENLDVSTNGLNNKELAALHEVKNRFFNCENHHWEGVELKQQENYLESCKLKTNV